MEQVRDIVARAATAATRDVPEASVRWIDRDNSFVMPGFETTLTNRGKELEILGGGMLQPKTLVNKGYDPQAAAGYACGLSLDRLAMLKYGIDDIRKLWQPPYVP